MRTHKTIPVMLFGAAMALCGCAGSSASNHISDKTAVYRNAQNAPIGLARVYILPTRSKGMFNDLNGGATISIYPGAANHGAKLGSTSGTGFIAFDIAPGDYDMVATADGGLSKAEKSFTLHSDTVYYLRPAFYRAAVELPKDSSRVPPGFTFDVVPADNARAEVQRLNMIALRPEAEAYLTHTYTAPAATPQPSGPSSFSSLEEKLRDLKRLREENLITQDDYDERRRTLLQTYSR